MLAKWLPRAGMLTRRCDVMMTRDDDDDAMMMMFVSIETRRKKKAAARRGHGLVSCGRVETVPNNGFTSRPAPKVEGDPFFFNYHTYFGWLGIGTLRA